MREWFRLSIRKSPAAPLGMAQPDLVPRRRPKEATCNRWADTYHRCNFIYRRELPPIPLLQKPYEIATITM